eukprot:CAMPEP_0182824738 /NCGR_PEP_ID=MMETSP0006_2-20121128/15454_1 /TAXON_ID=97485 /ORGANISM="Prymnesium parvum, Strain Texoma1" /LENGTH=131 /DNA_ID=CAMNT_0024951763 /DNA_START=716 /DNA_END=1111 /DNA_ORIENTATION=+
MTSHDSTPRARLPSRWFVILQIFELQPIDRTSPLLPDEFHRLHRIESRLDQCDRDKQWCSAEACDAMNRDHSLCRKAEVEPLPDHILWRCLAIRETPDDAFNPKARKLGFVVRRGLAAAHPVADLVPFHSL